MKSLWQVTLALWQGTFRSDAWKTWVRDAHCSIFSWTAMPSAERLKQSSVLEHTLERGWRMAVQKPRLPSHGGPNYKRENTYVCHCVATSLHVSGTNQTEWQQLKITCLHVGFQGVRFFWHWISSTIKCTLLVLEVTTTKNQKKPFLNQKVKNLQFIQNNPDKRDRELKQNISCLFSLFNHVYAYVFLCGCLHKSAGEACFPGSWSHGRNTVCGCWELGLCMSRAS